MQSKYNYLLAYKNYKILEVTRNTLGYDFTVEITEQKENFIILVFNTELYSIVEKIALGSFVYQVNFKPDTDLDMLKAELLYQCYSQLYGIMSMNSIPVAQVPPIWEIYEILQKQ